MSEQDKTNFIRDVVRHRVLSLGYKEIWGWAVYYAQAFSGLSGRLNTVGAHQVATLIAEDCPKTRDGRAPVAVLSSPS